MKKGSHWLDYVPEVCQVKSDCRTKTIEITILGSQEPLPFLQWIIGTWRDRVARVRTLSAYDPSILAQFCVVAVQLVRILDWKKMPSWKPTVLLMRPGIGQNLGLAHRARNSREFRVELSVQYTVAICANTGSKLSMQPLVSHKPPPA